MYKFTRGYPPRALRSKEALRDRGKRIAKNGVNGEESSLVRAVGMEAGKKGDSVWWAQQKRGAGRDERRVATKLTQSGPLATNFGKWVRDNGSGERREKQRHRIEPMAKAKGLKKRKSEASG